MAAMSDPPIYRPSLLFLFSILLTIFRMQVHSECRVVEIGRVVYVASGPYEGKLASIVNVVDGNRVLIDGPCSGVPRKAENLKNIQLTRFKLPIRQGSRTRTVKKAWESLNLQEKWESTVWAQKLKKRTLRAKMTDFDRFKLMKAKQQRNRIIRTEMAKLKTANK